MPAQAEDQPAAVDLALVLAVDISNSMTPEQYELQMAGLAQAFEDKAVQDAIVSGRHGAILVTLVAWSDKPRIAIPWTPLGSELEAMAFGERIRDLPRIAGNFTCMSDAMHFIEDRVLPLQPVFAERQIVDVSGDGRENCNPREAARGRARGRSSPAASRSTACRSSRGRRPISSSNGTPTT